MNKTERQFAIVLELQRNKLLKAEDLAQRFETSVRTIYRDVQALSEAGVPVIGSPGYGYSLVEGYFLPPVSLTVEEAVALLIGAEFVEQSFDNQYNGNARSSRGKIEAILPEPIKYEAARVRNNIRLRIATENNELQVEEKRNMAIIRQAMLDGKKIRFKYSKRVPEEDGSRETTRTVASYGLVFVQGGWLIVSQCDLRNDIRHFKVSRMSNVTITDEKYEIPADFDLHTYQPLDDRNVQVRVWFNLNIADKVKEANNYYMEDAELLSEGLYVKFRVRQPEELLQWLLGWGADAVVIEPLSFKQRVKKEIEKMQKRY
ncbi:helix-turn-helix transcriptional regulator [Paenibacillus kribbensis]|uniref:helix-turn-helix transcriptional regulator n=1 Tax=Paenibacillus kribbensis TaxID=172713 RepID=UPI000839A9AA|nr:YafY family protein [Paenibacillus kribbensis]